MKETKGRRRTRGTRPVPGWAVLLIVIAILCIAGVALSLAGCLDGILPGGPASGRPAPTQTPSIVAGQNAPPVSTAAVEQYIVLATNVERSDAGLAPLQWDAELAAVARSHSGDMAAMGYFSHINLRGEDPTDRAVALEYPVIKHLGGGRIASGIGENIGMMPTGNVADVGFVDEDAKAVAGAMVMMWMASPGHRENILAPGYDRIGVGVAYDGASYIATQNFW